MSSAARQLRFFALLAFVILGVGFLVDPRSLMSGLRVLGLADPWEPGPLPLEVARELDFAYRVLGAVLVGWGSTLLLTLHSRQSAWAAAAWPFGIWFVLDTSVSLWTGHPHNALLNTVSLLAFGLPHLMLRDGALREATPSD